VPRLACHPGTAAVHHPHGGRGGPHLQGAGGRQLWGPKAKTDNQILRVNMANTRRKIEENPAQPRYIFTEIGVGCRMIDPN